MLKWLLLKNKTTRKPWLLEPDRFLSNHKAHRLALAQGGYPSAASIMESARIKARKSLEEWAKLTGFQPEREEREIKKRSVSKKHKLITVLASILLIIAFFSLTPKGRALAEEAITTITEFFNNVLYIHPVGTSREDIHEIPEASPGVPDETEIKLNTLDEIPNYIDDSFLYLQGEDFEVVEILLTTYSYQKPSFTIRYFMGESDIVLSELWPSEDQRHITLGLEGEYFSYALSNGNVLEGSFLLEDRSFAAAMISGELVFSIFANNVASLEVMYEILDGLEWSNGTLSTS